MSMSVDKGNQFIKKCRNYLLLFCLTALAMLVFFPQRAQAYVRMDINEDGFKLSGTGEIEDFSDNLCDEYYKAGNGIDRMDYKITGKITFTCENPDEIPEMIKLQAGSAELKLYLDSPAADGSRSCTVSKEFYSDEDIDMYLEVEENHEYPLKYRVDLEVRKNKKKKPTMKFTSLPEYDLYEKMNGYFHVTVNDPYRDMADESAFSVSVSDKSVAKVTEVDCVFDCLYITVSTLKPGSADLIVEYEGATVKQKFTVKGTTFVTPGAISLTVGDSTFVDSYVFKNGGGDVDIVIKNVRSGNRSIVDVAGNMLIAKKVGTTNVSAVINGQNENFIVTVTKKVKPTPKPTLNQLKVSYKDYIYYPSTGKLYLKTRLTNKSKSTITKVKLKYTISIMETASLNKTFKVTIKPGKTVTKNVYIGTMVDSPYKVKVKALQFWYKK